MQNSAQGGRIDPDQNSGQGTNNPEKFSGHRVVTNCYNIEDATNCRNIKGSSKSAEVKSKDVIAAKAKENLRLADGGDRKSGNAKNQGNPKSDKVEKPINTNEELAKTVGVSHDT